MAIKRIELHAQMQVFQISVEPMERITLTRVQSESCRHAQLLQLERTVRFVHEHVARQERDNFSSPELSWSRFDGHGQFKQSVLVFVLFVCFEETESFRVLRL